MVRGHFQDSTSYFDVLDKRYGNVQTFHLMCQILEEIVNHMPQYLIGGPYLNYAVLKIMDLLVKNNLAFEYPLANGPCSAS